MPSELSSPSPGYGSAPSPQLRTLFPDFWRLDSLVRAEVVELSDDVLDWTSSRWTWAGWSIRQQVSHVASVPLRWLISRWGDQLFGDEFPMPMTSERLATFDSDDHDRRLHDGVFWEVEDVLGARVQRPLTYQWELMRRAHPDGISENPETGERTGMDLVATFRHIQFEIYTHIFNIQRSKMALGISPVVRLPNAGYHTVAGWDSGLPDFGAAVADLSRFYPRKMR